MASSKQIEKIALILVIVGGINWGLGIFGLNLVASLADATFGWLGTTVYALVGISALVLLPKAFK